MFRACALPIASLVAECSKIIPHRYRYLLTGQVNGRAHVATQNLWTILRRLRSTGYTKGIWIDALCIDQKNSIEMSSQVGLMADVYARAREVYIGLEGPLLKRLDNLKHDASIKAVLQGLRNGQHLHSLTSRETSQTSTESSARNLQTFRHFVDSTWFTRAWTVQEACLARKTTFLCAGADISWDDMAEAFGRYYEHRKQCCAHIAESLDPGLRTWLYRTYQHIEGINRTRRALVTGQHILRSLLYYQAMSASDPRDKYFAFRGLHTRTSKRSLPSPDYDKSKETVFTELTLWLLKDQGSLFALCVDLPDVTKSCPSWVPDWSVSAEDAINASYQRMRLDFLDMYNAAKGLRMQMSFSQTGHLRVKGLFLDRVVAVADRTFELDGIESNREVLSSWYSFAFPDAKSYTSDTFILIMMAGCYARPDKPVREARSADFAEWRRLVDQGDPAVYHEPIMVSHIAAVLKRRLFRTQSGYLGIGPSCTQPDDELWVLGGGAAPFILTRSNAECSLEYRLKGHCYVHGIMQGEGVSDAGVRDCILV